MYVTFIFSSYAPFKIAQSTTDSPLNFSLISSATRCTPHYKNALSARPTKKARKKKINILFLNKIFCFICGEKLYLNFTMSHENLPWSRRLLFLHGEEVLGDLEQRRAARFAKLVFTLKRHSQAFWIGAHVEKERKWKQETARKSVSLIVSIFFSKKLTVKRINVAVIYLSYLS